MERRIKAPKVAKVTRQETFTPVCPVCHGELHHPVSLDAWRLLPSSLPCLTCQTVVNVPADPEGDRMPVWTRDNTLDLFQRQLYALQSKVICKISKYVLEVQIKNKNYIAVVEGYSHGYWEHRVDLHPVAEQITMVICYRHNSCLRQHVLELCSPSGREYEAFTPPSWFDFEQRGGKAWAQVFTGALIAGHGKAYTMLSLIQEESPAAYYRYLRRKAQLSAHKQGHPAAV
jgi:hypothetical protein